MKNPHRWVPSTLGHGEWQCSYCLATNREIAVIGDPNHCNNAPELAALRDRLAVVEGALDTATDALTELRQWCDAYPVAIFTDPDFPKAAQVLKAAGMTLDGISAANFRHVLDRVRQITTAALQSIPSKEQADE